MTITHCPACNQQIYVTGSHERYTDCIAAIEAMEKTLAITKYRIKRLQRARQIEELNIRLKKRPAE